MTRDFLKKLGIEDNEVIDKIIDENSSDIGKAKGDLERITRERDDLNNTLKDRDGQLETLKKSSGDNEELKKQIEQLQADNQSIKLNAAVEKALIEAKARNLTAVKALLNLDNAEIGEDGTVKGLSEQIKTIQKDNDYLFEAKETKVDNSPKGTKPADSGSNQPQTKKPEEMTYEDFVNAEINQ